jgi:hypothetical protein
MNDDFLYASRPPVRKAFADSLRQRLITIETKPIFEQKGVVSMKATFLHGSRWKFALPTLILLTAAVLVFAVSEPVRAKTMEFIRVVAGFNVEERSESPLKDLEQNEVSPAQTNTDAQAIIPDNASLAPTVAEPTVYAVLTSPIDELLQDPPFQFSFPTWAPDGFILDETAGIAGSSNWVFFVWNNSDQREIELLIERDYTGYTIPAGENSSEEITINGIPALLINGWWDAQHQWDAKRGISLDWEMNDRHYHLNYTERGPAHNEIVPIQGDMDTITEELLKMAESIP